MVDRAPETLADIAARLGRPLSTVRNTWTRDPEWPAAVGKRGRWKTYDPGGIDDWLRDHIERQAVALEPGRLYTAQQLEAAGIGIKAGTIRADLTRRRWPEPDDTEGGVNRWCGRTVTQALEGRRGYRHSTPE